MARSSRQDARSVLHLHKEVTREAVAARAASQRAVEVSGTDEDTAASSAIASKAASKGSRRKAVLHPTQAGQGGALHRACVGRRRRRVSARWRCAAPGVAVSARRRHRSPVVHTVGRCTGRAARVEAHGAGARRGSVDAHQVPPCAWALSGRTPRAVQARAGQSKVQEVEEETRRLSPRRAAQSVCQRRSSRGHQVARRRCARPACTSRAARSRAHARPPFKHARPQRHILAPKLASARVSLVQPRHICLCASFLDTAAHARPAAQARSQAHALRWP